MLVLSRKQGERILIGSEIEVRILSAAGKRVRLGITCPGRLRILRSEVLEKELTEKGHQSPKAIPCDFSSN
jgi:carbon storage regulator